MTLWAGELRRGRQRWALQPDHLDPEAGSLTDRPCVTTGIPAPHFLRVLGVVRERIGLWGDDVE